MKSNCFKLTPLFYHQDTFLKTFSFIFLILLVFCSSVHSAQVELAWDSPTSPLPAGYKIHYGTASKQYTESIDAGNCNTWSMAGLQENKTYYFAATAYDSRGGESGFSNEVSKFIPSGGSNTDDRVQLAFSFNTNAEAFAYTDDLFRGTSRPVYASGSYAGSGGYGGGGLKVTLGGVDAKWIVNGMSGGWKKTFDVVQEGAVAISLKYRLTIAGEYEADEFSQMLVSVDGKLIGTDGRDYLLELRGTDVDTPLQDSGWRTATIRPTLSKGVHTLAVGVWNNKKTGALETTQAYIDDIVISQTIIAPDADADEFSVEDGDCNDSNKSIYPGAAEICGDSIDQDCDGRDGLCDEDVDNDGDGFSENEGDTDDANPTVYPGAPEICDDNIDNDMDGWTDCLDTDCHAMCGGGAVQAFGFDRQAEGFVYKDDMFRGTSRPAYASGNYVGSEGYSGGGLKVTLGGMDAKWVTNGMSGGWSKTFEMFEGGAVAISFRYRLTIAGEYEADEYGQVLVSIDGKLIGTDGRDHLLELRGTDADTALQDSGWRTATIRPTLSKGLHTLAVGVWNNKKTGALETTRAYFDDIMIELNAFQVTDAPPAGEVKYRINTGGPMVTVNGITWVSDRFYSGGQNTSLKDPAIQGTTQDVLYRSERYGNQFGYRIPVEPGIYMLRLHFAEVNFASSGKRIFDVSVENGQAGISDFDIVSEGGTYIAVMKILDNISVRDGFLNIDFKALVDSAKVCAMEVVLTSIDL
ncbi:malectin domain-containing carbohydrate-binding protein [Desulfococcus sp.]|uniref:malectin domain-containing carbohydrate-binding protein n=1 Tax=Desulfococcus sp. TaxID=2025834 RepID=UPI00359308AD